MPTCTHCHQPQTAAPVICSECYRALTERTVSMEHDKLIEALEARAAMVGVSAKDAIMLKEATAQLAEQAAEVRRWKALYESMERTWKRTEVELAEKDKQLAEAVEDLRGLCWCCAHGKKWDKAPAWSNMTTCEHIRERGSLAVGGGKAGKDCPHWEWRGAQEAGEGSLSISKRAVLA